MVVNLIVIFLLNAVSNCIGTLKMLFISKQMVKPVYILVFSDAMLFSYSLKLVSDSSNVIYILAFAFGKVFGIYLADIIEKKIAIGLLEISVYTDRKKGKILADFLRKKGFSVTTYIGFGMNGKGKLVINIIIKRRDYEILIDILKGFNSNISMSIAEIRAVTGKLVQDELNTMEIKTKAV